MFRIDWRKVEYYLTPWGVDDGIFHKVKGKEREFDNLMTGYVSKTEALTEVYEAVKAIGGKMIHLGGNIGLDGMPGYRRMENVSDEELVMLLNACKYVWAGRHYVGFEIIGLEGAFCGAKPIYMRYPCYLYYFRNVGLFVRPFPTKNLIKDLIEILSKRPEPIPREMLERFRWANIAPCVWNAILERIK